MKKLLIATRNPGKLKEFRSFLSDFLPCHSEFSSESKISRKEMLKQVQHDNQDKIEIVSLKDSNIKEDIEEDGKTYEENSKKKALFYSKISDLPTIADDGGIEITALGGLPGIKTRRWLGYEMTDENIMDHMIKVAKKLPDNNREAFFKTVVCLALPNGTVFCSKGEVRGIISKKPYLKLLKGYPFRSFFYLPEIKKFYHEDELTDEEQKLYNHRFKAVEKLQKIIIEVFV